MKRITNILLSLGVTAAIATGVSASDKEHNAAIVGIWEGDLDNLHVATLNITDESGPLQGAMLFYLIRRDEGKPPTSTPGIPEPLFNPQFDGKTLTFQLSHRHAHADTASDAPVSFHLELIGPNEAKLVRIPQDGPPYLRMFRKKP
jgi:hypothetical protein